MASSHLISSISSALNHLDLSGVTYYHWTVRFAALQLKIELRNMQAQLVIGSRNLGHLPSLLSRIEGAVARILLQEIPNSESIDTFVKWIDGDALPEVRGFAKQISDECCTNPLSADDAVALADSILENAANFWALVHTIRNQRYQPFLGVDVIDAFVAQVTFLKCLLALAKGAGAQLQDLMIPFQPFAINAARVFISDQPYVQLYDWYEEVSFKCSAAIGEATAPEVFQAYTQALSSSTVSSAPAGVLENFLDSLVSVLWDVLRSMFNSRVKDQLKVLYERLRFCRCILKRKPGGFDGEIGDQIGVLICGAGMLVCSLHHAHVDVSYPDRLSKLLERLGALQAPVFEIHDSESTAPTAEELGSGDSAHVMEDVMISDRNEETATLGHQPQQSSSAPQVAGFQNDEVNLVLNRLMRGSKQLQIVPICGMAGVGKTTFASALYNHPSILYHFQSRARCSISQVMDKRKVMLQLLNQEFENYADMTEDDMANKLRQSLKGKRYLGFLDSISQVKDKRKVMLKHLKQESESYANMTEDDMANKLRQSLKGKRYLIFLDDVWTTEAWHSLAASFPDDATQSRIICTSRHRDVVPNQQPYLLRLRDDDECLEILKMKLSHEKCWTSEFGMTIAKMCKGLPLIAIIVAGLLGSTTKQQGWKGILDHLSLSGISSEKQCNSVLELSFNHLSNDLKLCFLYFSAFPEDEEIYLKRLLRLWIGEGFVRECESKRIEDVALEYMEDLIQRSLVMVVQNRSIGGVKTCRIHDVIHDFCLRKAKQDNFFHILSQRGDDLLDFNEPHNLQRLSIHSDPSHFKEARLFCPRAHSMLFFSTSSNLFDMVFIVQIFKLLRVLDTCAIFFSSGIPSEIELLTQLRYLSIRGNLRVIPSSLGNLSKLETLIGEFELYGVISFPPTFWNLHKIKWLSIKCDIPHGFSLPTENLENSRALFELETLCGVVFNSYNSMEQQMRKFPNIRRLKCSILPDAEQLVRKFPDIRRLEYSGVETRAKFYKIANPELLNQLECLSIFGKGALGFGLGSRKHLRSLSLGRMILSREDVADIGKLPNLEVLKLYNVHIWGGMLDMEEGEFSKLSFLELIGITMKSWTISDEQLPCVKKLLLYLCEVPGELPYDCFKTSATLEEITVNSCSRNVENFAREIQEAQKEYGSLVKVSII